MKEVRFFYTPEPEAGQLPADEAQHALRVLRLQMGDEIHLMDGTGGFYRAVITEATGHHCRYRIEAREPQQPEWTGMIHLAVAPTKNMDRMEWLAKSILDLIASDPLAREKLRMISPDGIPVRGEALPEMETICLPSLLTGCLDYIVEYVPYNTEGQETIENWLCTENEKYTGKVRCPFSVETEIPKSDPDCPAGKEPAETGGQGEINSGEVRQENRTAADEPGREEKPEPVGPQARDNARNFNGINIFSGAHVGQIQYVQMPAAGGGSMMELLSLDTSLYHLFVTDGSLFQGNTFSVAKTVSLNQHIRQDIKDHFLELRPAEQAELIRFPAVFASVNRGDRETEAVHMAMLGRITAIHVQSSVISFEWKAFCPFPQQILNRNESLFSIWHAPAANELEEEHWTMKPVPLIRSLQTAGFDPYRSMSAGQAWN